MIVLRDGMPGEGMTQCRLVFDLPAKVEAAIAQCVLLGLDPIGARAAAFDAYGRAPLPAFTAEVTPAGTPVRTARAGRRAGCDAVPAGASA